jgi:hypothetical protein
MGVIFFMLITSVPLIVIGLVYEYLTNQKGKTKRIEPS